jgi:hypothetical protein
MAIKDTECADVAVAALGTSALTMPLLAAASGSCWHASVPDLRLVRHPETGQRHSHETDAECLQRRAG